MRQREAFIGKLQQRYGLALEEAQRRVDEWVKSVREEEHTQPKTSTGRP
ncbi:MAG: hypothetical protein LAP40_18385 [Acidobacteriia bacterium]|nr:hypothetical protein [Terriglobia bacterium]